MRWRTAAYASMFIAAALATAAWFAPYLYSEVGFRRDGPPVQLNRPALIRGRWFDDYFVVEDIDDSTVAIGEPRYYQGNYSYLVLGRQRALLFDAGTGSRDIVPVVRSLTHLPVTVVPSHLHFDHVGALGRFERTALPDAPELRARAADGLLELQRYEFLGFGDALKEPRFAVNEWWRDGSRIDLGSRRLFVLSTPGHTPTSVSLYDADRRLLFAGDFIYPGPLYAFLPGASRSQYLASTRRLLDLVHPTTRIFAAHMAENPAGAQAPVLGVADLRALAGTLQQIEAGTLPATGFYPRFYRVNDVIDFATGFTWNGS